MLWENSDYIYLHTLSQDYLYLYTVDVWFDEATGERDNEKQNEEKTNHRVRHVRFQSLTHLQPSPAHVSHPVL